jgi:hypothetical protein
LKVGAPSSFYHEGGSGEKHWVNGWRYGIVLYIPIKGKYKGWAQLEIPVKLWTWDDGKPTEARPKKRSPGWARKPSIKAWCHIAAINEPGDFVYHGPKLDEIVRERKAEKKKDQKKADRRVRRAA